MRGRLKRQMVAVMSSLAMFFLGANLIGRADNLVNVMTPDSNFIANPAVVVDEVQHFVNQAQILQGPNYQYQKFYWELKSIKANGVRHNRLSTNTTQLEVRIFGRMNSFDMGWHEYFRFDTFNFVIIGNGSNQYKNLDINEATNASHFSDTFVNLSGGDGKSGATKTLKVDLKNIKALLPLRIGIQYTTNNKNLGTITYELGRFVASDLALKPTINGTLSADSQVISGYGVPGDQVISSVDPTRIGKVDRNGNYSIHLAAPLKDYLAHNDEVTVTETNENGDTGTAVQKKLSIAAIAQSPEFDLEDEDNIDLTDINQLVKMLKLDSGEAVGAKFFYDLDETELKRRIAQLEAGSPITLPIYATKDGYMRSNIVNVQASNHSDALAFGQTTTKLDFGKAKKVPLVTTDYFPEKQWGIIVHDHRKNKRAWKITAKAQAGDQDKNELADYLWYKEGTNQTRFKDHESILVYQKSANAGTTDTEISFRSAGQDKQAMPNQRSIFVQAGPKMKTGKYNAKILWSLIDAP